MQHLGELTNKLKEQVDSESKEMEQAVQSVFQGLSESLRKCAVTELNTISKDMEDRIRELKKRQSGISAHYWKQSILVNTVSALFLVIMSVCVTAFFGWRIQSQNEKLTSLTVRVDSLKKQEAALKDWGISMHQNGQLEYLVFPKGLKLEIRQTTDGLPAVLLKR